MMKCDKPPAECWYQHISDIQAGLCVMVVGCICVKFAVKCVVVVCLSTHTIRVGKQKYNLTVKYLLDVLAKFMFV